MRWRLWLVLWLVSGVVAPAAAQQVPETDKGIVVTARPQTPEKTAHKFIGQVVDLSEGQLARFEEPICLTISGTTPQLMAAVEARFRKVALAVGVRMKTGKCETNLQIMFVADTAAFMKVIRKRHAHFFSDLADADKIDAFRPEAIRAWRLVVLRDDMGHVGVFSDHQDDPPVFETATRTVTINAILILDRQSVTGKSSTQIADYAVMRTLAGARPPSEGGLAAESILSLFDPAVTPPPPSVSRMDYRLLKGLYAMRASVMEDDAQAQGHALARQIVTPGKRKAKPKPAP